VGVFSVFLLLSFVFVFFYLKSQNFYLKLLLKNEYYWIFLCKQCFAILHTGEIFRIE